MACKCSHELEHCGAKQSLCQPKQRAMKQEAVLVQFCRCQTRHCWLHWFHHLYRGSDTGSSCPWWRHPHPYHDCLTKYALSSAASLIHPTKWWNEDAATSPKSSSRRRACVVNTSRPLSRNFRCNTSTWPDHLREEVLFHGFSFGAYGFYFLFLFSVRIFARNAENTLCLLHSKKKLHNFLFFIDLKKKKKKKK